MSRIQIRWPHVVAFLLGTLGIWGAAGSEALQGGQALSLQVIVLAISGTTGLVWALFAHTILPDFTGGTGTTKPMLGGSGRPPMPPRNERRMLGAWLPGAFVGACAALVVLWSLAMCSGCSQLQAAFPVLDQVEKIVLADLEAGKGLEAVEIDVAQAVAGKVGTAVVILVDDALQALADFGVIPAKFLPPAQEMRVQATAEMLAKGIRR